MKGKLYKSEDGEWRIKYLIDWSTDTYKSYPLHPDDAQQIYEDTKVFDNIEARIATWPECDFEYVNGFAKLEYPELEGTLKLTDELILKRQIFNWLSTRFTEEAPLHYIIREYRKKFLNERDIT